MAANASSGSDIYSAILNFLTAIAALAAVVLAVFSEKRARKIAVANVRPILAVEIIRPLDRIEVILVNKGLGTAMRVSPTFTKDSLNSTHSLAAVLQTPNTVGYDCAYAASFEDIEGDHVTAGDKVPLLHVTRRDLTNHRCKPDVIKEIFATLNDKIHGVTISINYEDVLGNKQKEYRVTLK